MGRADFTEIGIVYRKDMIEFFRDYRSLLVMIFVPVVIYPLMLILPAIVASKIKSEIFQRNSTVALIGDYGPIEDQLRKTKSLTIVKASDPDDYMKRLTKGKLDLVVKFPDDFKETFEKLDEVPSINLIYNNKRELSLVSAQHVSTILLGIKNKILKQRVQIHDLRLPIQYDLTVEPIAIEQKDVLVSDPIRNVVPFLLFTMVLVAISYPAIDIITGERERKSLPLLLLSPTRRRNIMVGKLAVVSTCGFLTIVLGLLSIYITFTYASQFQSELEFTFSGQAVLYCMITSIPLVLSLSALSIYLASWCKTFQQGQGYFVPFLLGVIAATGVCSMPELELSSGVAFIPIVNTALGIKEFLSGSPNWLWQGVTFIVSIVFALFVTWHASRILDREDLMFDLDKPKEARWKESDYAVEIGILATVAFLLMFYLGQSLQQWDMSYGSILTQLFVILAPSAVVLKYVGRLSKETLSLKLPTFWQVTGALFVAPLCILLAYFTHYLQSFVVPTSEEFTKIFTKMIVQPDRPIALVITAIALAPAICEELMFRGCILGLVRKRFGNLNSIFFVGILFGLFHLSIFRILPTAVIGIFLTALTIYTGSIVPAMLIHFLNNASAVVIARNKIDESIIASYWPAVVVVGLVGIFILWKFKPKIDK